MRLCLIGWGAISKRVNEILLTRQESPVDLAAVAIRKTSAHGSLPAGARFIHEPADLDELKIDAVVEAASREAVAAWGDAVLRRGLRFVVSSVGAFTDEALLERFTSLAERYGGQLVIPAGALGGIGALRAAALMPLESVVHTMVKPPKAWRGSAAEELIDLDSVRKKTVFFTGSAREAASRFPANANVTAIAALAGIGFDRTKVDLAVDPSVTRNSHELKASGGFGTLSLHLENAPLPANPRSSAMTALTLIRAIEDHNAALLI